MPRPLLPSVRRQGSRAVQHHLGELIYDYDDPLTALTPGGRKWALIKGGGDFPEMAGPMFVTYDDLDPDEPARFGLRVQPHHCNAVDTTHGGMLGTFLDTAFAQGLLASRRLEWNVPTIHLSVDFLGPSGVGDWLESRVKLTHDTRRMAFMAGVILCGDRPVLRGQAIFKIKPLEK